MIFFCRLSVFLAGCVVLVSCNSVPEGLPPVGPIINPLTETSPAVPEEKSAVNYMITSLSTTCPVIANAGNNLPVFTNEFTLSSADINHMPMQLWRSLINMKMISPSLPGNQEVKYKLVSDFVESKTPGIYFWEMRVLGIEKSDEIWKERIQFKASAYRPL